MNNKKSTGLLLSILGVISLVLITTGVTYAFFSYVKEGETENTISTGTITFLYDELEGTGTSISIQDALPMTDDEGKALTGAGNVFTFKITSEISGQATMPYQVTARMKDGSTLGQDQVKLYLTSTDTTGTNHTVGTDGVKTFKDLSAPTGITLPDGTVEKLIFDSIVNPASNYNHDFELRMWINGDEDSTVDVTDYSALEFKNTTDGTLITSTAYYTLPEASETTTGDSDDRSDYVRIAYVATDSTITGNDRGLTAAEYAALDATAQAKYEAGEQYYPLNGRKFTVTVNVYANAQVVSAGTGA